jgi:GT2 family glycosyltransferase
VEDHACKEGGDGGGRSFSIISVNYNNALLLVSVVNRTLATLSGHSFEIIIVDNDSTDGSLSLLRDRFADIPCVSVVGSGRNGGFGFGCNRGAAEARSDVLWFLNSDAWVSDSGGLEEALALCRRDPTGIVGTSVVYDDAKVSPQGGGDLSFSYLLISSFRLGALFRSLPEGLQKFMASLLRNWPGLFGRYARSLDHNTVRNRYQSLGVGGASFLIRRSVYSLLGGFDEGFFLYDEDGDLCIRCVEKGFVNWIDPRVVVHTYRSASTSKVPSLKLKKIKCESRLRLIDKHFSGGRRVLLRLVTVLTWRLL